MQTLIPEHLKGLDATEVEDSRQRFGFNSLRSGSETAWYDLLVDIFKEPMLILLVAVSIIYLIIGDWGEAAFMFVAIVAVSAISFYQDNRSRKALQELEKLNEPLSTVIRNSEILKIPTREIVVGDLCVVEEGKMVNADGRIVHSNDFSVNEASLTGESMPVFKRADTADSSVYSGTIIVSGLAVFEVEKIGAETRIGRIGTSMKDIGDEASPLQLQIRTFVKNMAIWGIIVFVMICIYRFYQTGDIIESLLSGLTLAMSVLPEEIPVAFTTFMALGAWKLINEGIIVKRSSVVETLGSTTVICTDKTGTITQNSMHLHMMYDFSSGQTYLAHEFSDAALTDLISYAMWASEPVPFDPMEKELHRIYGETANEDLRPQFHMAHEYPLGGIPPMMTHIFENDNGNRIVAAKGAPEAILEVSELDMEQLEDMRAMVRKFSGQGFRVLGVGASDFAASGFPPAQQDLVFRFLGLLIFQDPPKPGIRNVFSKIYQAGIKVKMITGDNTDTAVAIAQQAGIINDAKPVEGQFISSLGEEELRSIVRDTVLFTRMFPDAKLEVVKTLKADGEVVAMLGDGVNDGPALKAAHIGVAMGHKGTEIAKSAASLVITDDDLDKLITGIAAGRRIYTNLKKAVQYIISIHIPIILTVSLPLFLGWVYPAIFTPVHVIFLELIMGPTCSIVYENEPIERHAMSGPPRRMADTFLSWRELAVSILQGLMITGGVLTAYQWMAQNGASEEKTRAMVFATLVLANIFLSFANRSFYYSLFECFMRKNLLFPVITLATLIFLLMILYLPAVSGFFHVTGLTVKEISISVCIAFGSILWFEIYKIGRRVSKKY
ncbi:MAG: cation-translocating P-type ATPase [Saprospiraceae bacterium]